MAELLYRIGRFAARRRGTVVLVWLLVLAAAGGAYVCFGGPANGEITIPGTPTAQVTDRLQSTFPEAAGGSGTIVFHTEDGSAITASQREAISERIERATTVAGVESIVDPFTTQAEREKQAAKVTAGRAKLADARTLVAGGQGKIERAKAKLRDGQAKLDAAKTELEAGRAQLAAAKAKLPAAQAEIDAGRAKLAAGQAKLDAAKKKLAAGQAQLDAGKAQLAAQQAQLDAAVEQAKQDGTFGEQKDQFDAAQAQLDAGKAQLAAKQAELDAGKAKIAANQRKLDAGKAKLAAGQAKLDAGRAKLAAGQAKLDAGKATIAENEAKLAAGSATIKKKQALITRSWKTIREKQAQLKTAPSKLAARTRKLETGAALLDLASGYRLVSSDGSAAIAMVTFTQPQLAVAQSTKDALIASFRDDPVAGLSIDFSSSIATDLPALIGPNEVAGLVVAAVVLFVLLGTLVASGLPIVTALIGVGTATLGALSLSNVLEMTSVTPILGIMLGLAVGIDYALFIVNRHRRQLREGYSVEESIALANGTSGNAVVFAGSTVVIALVALNLTGIPFLGLIGTIAAASVAIAVLVAVTLTPALLSFAGVRVLRRKERAQIESGCHETPTPATPLPTWRAVGQVAIGIVVPLLIALPAASMRLALPIGSSEAASSTQYRAYTTLADKFGEGQNGMLLVIADLPAGTTDQQLVERQVEVAKAISALHDVAAVAPVLTSDDHRIAAFQVVPEGGPTSVSTEQLVSDIRAASKLAGGIKLGVAGQTSAAIDISEKLADALPVYLGVVLGLSVLIMIVVFRSLLVPLVATGGFALSLFAGLGGTVAIYQWGWLSSVFQVSDPGPILNFLPTALAGILFGLAMDYTLFLASGMREAYAHGAPSRTAVVLGFRAGRSVVTAAAIIMVSVFGGFVFAENAMIRPIGFALAFGVFVDAFVVRMVILPGLLHLIGDRAWRLPRWFDRLIPNVDIEGAALERQHPHVVGAPQETPHDDPAPAQPAAATVD